MQDEVRVFDLEGALGMLDGADEDVLGEGGFADVVEGEDFGVGVEQGLGLGFVDVAEDTGHWGMG